MKIWFNGQLVEQQDAKLSIYDHGALYGDGVFEGIRAYGGKIFQCDAHLDRLMTSAREIRLEVPYSKAELTDAMYDCMGANGQTDIYIRLVVTRGDGGLGLNPFKCSKPNVFIVADNIELYDPELYTNGMPVIICKTVRTSATMLSPKVKSLNYLNNIAAKIEGLDAGVQEVLMLNSEGNLAEGSGDNIFIVQDGQIVTPPESAGILMGITRGVIMHLARKMDIPVSQRDITPQQLFDADECFLTGTAAEVIPIVSVDGKPIANAKPGKISLELVNAFREFVTIGEEVPYDG
ncbi:MAG: branched-chain-amino-acid transaminase [Phycisphaerae bacterium]|nr:branched-chain-amino-acid transaminase [Phycisphaerae bacterium]